ncbi:hypothetical protein G6F65_016059 [Rhizopus arrhizus]|nr:hypothetical protein G6F65_016059 [Rhizopus arrhizus]
MARAQARCMNAHPAAWWKEADGVHLRTADAARLTARPELPKNALVGVSAHDNAQVVHARDLGADFAVLGPVLDTPSHPGAQTLGWEGFVQGNRDAGIPVFALGGQSTQTVSQALRHGAHGIAGIRGVL